MIRTNILTAAVLGAGITAFSGIAAAGPHTATAAATTSLAARAVPFSTDEARAEAAKLTAAANRAASLRPFAPLDSEVVPVVDTDSARRAAAQATARQAHDRYLSGVLRAGAGITPVPVRVTDTDSARAAAAQEQRQRHLLADHAEQVKMLAKSGPN
jgi:hypothetical protein